MLIKTYMKLPRSSCYFRNWKKKYLVPSFKKLFEEDNHFGCLTIILTSISSCMVFSERVHFFWVWATVTSALFFRYLPSMSVLAFISCSWSLKWAIMLFLCWSSISFSFWMSISFLCSILTCFLPFSSLYKGVLIVLVLVYFIMKCILRS